MPQGYDYINVDVIDRLVTRFNLVDHTQVQNPLVLPRVVNPVTNVDELLKVVKVEQTYSADPAAVGVQTVFTVPDGKRVWVYAFHVLRSVGATLTTSYMQFVSNDTPATNKMVVETWTAAADKAGRIYAAIPLMEGGLIQIYVAAYNAGDEMICRLLYLEEDAYKLGG